MSENFDYDQKQILACKYSSVIGKISSFFSTISSWKVNIRWL